MNSAPVIFSAWIRKLLSLLQGNKFSEDYTAFKKLEEIMMPRDPFFKAPPKSPDTESQLSWHFLIFNYLVIVCLELFFMRTIPLAWRLRDRVTPIVSQALQKILLKFLTWNHTCFDFFSLLVLLLGQTNNACLSNFSFHYWLLFLLLHVTSEFLLTMLCLRTTFTTILPNAFPCTDLWWRFLEEKKIIFSNTNLEP